MRTGDLWSNRNYYVTMKRGKRTAWLAGPFSTHEEALNNVDQAKAKAIANDPFHDFDFFGTASTTAVIKTAFGAN